MHDSLDRVYIHISTANAVDVLGSKNGTRAPKRHGGLMYLSENSCASSHCLQIAIKVLYLEEEQV